MMPRTMSETTHLKMACERCGGHIEYPSEMAGHSIQCPHCQHTIKLPPPPPIPPHNARRLPRLSQALPGTVASARRHGISMKTFTSVFLAIIAAVIAIIGVFFLIRPFLQYNEAKRLCLAEIDSALADSRDLSGGLDAQVAQLNSSQRRIIRAEQTLISVLAHKPLLLPLTSKERKLLSEAKSAVRSDTLQRLKYSFEAYKAAYGDYPSGTPTEILKALRFDADRTQLNQNGELVDPDGKPYPLEFSEIEALVPQ
jgi:hypothetical protein